MNPFDLAESVHRLDRLGHILAFSVNSYQRKKTFNTVVNFHYSLTGRAGCLSWIVLDVRLSAEGADHIR
jgi:hypothetical protein